MTNIPGYAFNEVTLINKGGSEDKKYRVRTTDGCLMLLRLSDIKEYERKIWATALFLLFVALVDTKSLYCFLTRTVMVKTQ